ncbi:hypothetical protein OJAV_G00165770 [Oryzias javanicus]|uniref:Interferon/interleukin receptor domain-containing protein n=1 Tax=Oryzias javanicus TaxID=123683 RepID=A0A3S2NZS5_ORYJA|nr:hypothetical protein OJAV_G00165770 [Oryzias javanicus]
MITRQPQQRHLIHCGTQTQHRSSQPGNMERGRLLFVFWCLHIQAGIVCLAGHTCVSDYYRNISCTFNALDQHSSYNLTILWKGAKASCPLRAVGHKFGANCQVIDDEGDYFSNTDQVQIYLCKNSNCTCVEKQFFPHRNIQLAPPDIKVQYAAETINVTSLGKAESIYIQTILEFQMALQRSHSSEIRNLSIKLPKTFFEIERSTLTPGAQYCVKIRLTVQNKSNYKAVWSDWSRAECWINGKEPDGLLIILVKFLGPAGLSVVVLLCVCCSPTARMKIKTLSYTPSPATFFQPLFQQDKGNLQEWFSKNGKFILAYKTEEDLRTDAVTVVPRTTTKDREEIVPDSSDSPHAPCGVPCGSGVLRRLTWIPRGSGSSAQPRGQSVHPAPVSRLGIWHLRGGTGIFSVRKLPGDQPR